MKILKINNEQFKADKIIKNQTDILGQNLNGNEVFAFRGISDFAGFTVIKEDGEGCDFDTLEPTIADLQTQIFKLTTQLINGGAL
ncbi:hypothetical protein [Clostridium beijerinckii]|uniref:Phage protein n=1 Tax=Clostridium beijerinckii TaxID=1520 RepID=A0AAX0B6D8_CLOBE|nr:hypothetical protein [Clostridium beijerinckii]NRT90168.1 hypothetical protein [Clostridium beijerinckii]NYC69698.1 hypothetical protein [Clostridium beijerinckii]